VFVGLTSGAPIVRTGTEETSSDLQLEDRRRHVPIDPTGAAPNEPTLGTQFDRSQTTRGGQEPASEGRDVRREDSKQTTHGCELVLSRTSL